MNIFLLVLNDKGEKNDFYAKSIVLYLRFSNNSKPPWISSLTKAGRRFDNITHAQKVHTGKFHFQSALSSHFVFDA